MIFKQETVKSWFSGIKTSINNEIIQPFQNAEQIIWKYNQAIQHNSLTQKGWERLLAQSDDGLKAYLTNIKGTTASMTGYTVSLQDNITGFKKVSSAITQYNALATAGTQKQNEFSTAVATTNGRLGGYLRGLGGAKASLSGYVNSLISATAKTIVLQAATITLNAAVSMGTIAAISLAVKGFDKLINSAKRASDAANEVFSESNSKVQQNKEEIKSLDELIQKYKELRENENLDTDGRKQIKTIQNDIANLVGVQAKNLDLVNGKLDEEIRKLDKISEKQAKNSYETATANYNNAVRANKNAAGNSSIAFVDGYAYVGDREKDAEKILQDAGFINYYMQGGRKQVGGRGVGNNSFSTIVFDTYDRDGNLLKGAQEKADYLQSMIDVLEQNGQRATDLYSGLIKQRDNYLKYIDDQQNAANDLIDSWMTYSQFSNDELSRINVDSTDTFEQYRQKMIDEAKSDDTIGKMISDGILSSDDLETAINNFMATSETFSVWYDQWKSNLEGKSSLSNSTPTFNIESFSEAIESLSDLQSTYNDFYNDVNKDKVDFTFEISDIEKLREDFGGVCQSFDEFEKLATSSSTTAEQMQKAFDGLATEFVFNSGVMDGLSSSTREQIISQLELQGLLGVNQLLTKDFTKAYENATAAGLDFSNATLAQISGFIQEGQYAEDTKQKIYLYALQKMLANENCLSTYGDILALEALCKNLGITTEALALFARAKNLQQRIDDGTAYPSEVKWLERTKDEIKKVASEVSLTSSGYTNMGQSAANAAKSADKGSKSKEKEVDIMAELIKEMGVYQDKLKAVKEARETYNEYGKISVDQAKDIVDADFKLLAAYGDEQAALEDLGRAKLNEMQIQLARNAIDTINKIQSEAEATQYLAGANEHLVGTSLDATEAMLQQAVAAAKLRGELQGQAADTILKGYQNGAMMLGQVDFGFDLSEAEKAKKDAEKESEKSFEKQYNWIERLLDKFSRITDKWKSSVDKFTSWWNKNWSLDKAICSNRNEIEANVDAYNYYNKKANSVGLSKKYRDLVDNGKISIQDIHDEKLAEKIDKYIEWKDKMRDCIDTIEELYDAEREMIRQKFDNMIEYYDTVNTKVQSIVSKVNSLFDLNEARGKRTDINDLLEKFNGYSDIIGTTTSTTDGDSGADIKQHLLSDEEVAEIKKEIEHQESSIYDTATYKKLLNDIEKLEADKEKKGAKFSKANEKKLQNYYKKKKALEENATADTVTSYAKIYDAYLKLQNKLDAGKSLTKAQRVKYNDYVKQLEEYSSARSKSIADLNKKLEDNVETSSVEAVEKAYDDQKKELEDSYKRQIEDVKGDVQGTQQYKNLIAQRDNLKESIADLTAKKEAGTIKKSENKRLEKYLKQLDALEAKIAAIDEGATSENISDYIKAYDRLVKLQSKKKLTEKESAEYDNLTAQLKAWNTEKQDILESLNRQLADAMEELDAAQLEAVNETTADIAKSQQEAYEIAKQIAELQVSTLENELALIDSALSKIEKRLGLYKKFSADTLKDLGYLDADDASTQDELYTSTFTSFIEEQTKKRVNLLNQKDIYEKLIDAVATHDYDQIAEMYKNGVFEQYGDTFDKVVEMLNDNTFDGFSATWVDEWTQSLDKVESDIYDLDMSLQDLKDQFREEVTFRAINDAIEKLGYLKDVVKDASGLIDDELLYDADGSFSEFGTAKVATLVEQLELAQQLAYEYAQKIAVAQADTSYASDKDKEAAIQELRKSYNQQILEAKGYSDSIVSLYKNQAKQEIESLKNIIAKRKEALQAKKDYYDYDKSIKSKTKDIEAIQAQIDALTNIDSAEARARKAQLESDLADLNDELDEMKKEHEYTLQINALDDFSDRLSETLENVAKDAVEILNEQKGIIESATKLYQQSSDVIQNTIDTLAKFYGGNSIDLGQTTGITPITEKTSNMDASSIGLGNGIRELKPGESLGLSEEAFEKFKSLMPFNVCDNQSYIMLNNMHDLVSENNAMVRNAVNAMQNRDVAPVVNLHYDNLINVEGSVDKDFAKVLPNYLEKSCEYTLNKLRNDLHTLGWRR